MYIYIYIYIYLRTLTLFVFYLIFSAKAGHFGIICGFINEGKKPPLIESGAPSRISSLIYVCHLQKNWEDPSHQSPNLIPSLRLNSSYIASKYISNSPLSNIPLPIYSMECVNLRYCSALFLTLTKKRRDV